MLALPHGAAEIGRDRLRAADLHDRMARQVRREVLRDRNRAHARDRRRRAESRTSCAGSDGRRRRRSPPGWSARPARSCSRRPCRPGRRARGRSRRSPGCLPRTRRASTDTSPSAPPARPCAARAFARRSSRSMLPLLSHATTTTLQPGHRRARRVGAVRRRRDQDDVALRVAAVAVVGADRHQAGELALRAGVRLQRHGGEPGDLAQRAPRARRRSARSPPPARRGANGCMRENSGQRDREHLGRRVQLHRAGAERNHRRVEADVLPLEAADVAHHLRFGVMRVEHRMRQERRRARAAPAGSAVDRGSRADAAVAGRAGDAWRTPRRSPRHRRRSSVSSSEMPIAPSCDSGS